MVLRNWLVAVSFAGCTLTGIGAQAQEADVVYSRCETAFQSEQWQVAADCFVAFYREFGDAPNLDRALFNGAIALEQIHEVGKAIQLRIFLLKDAPTSPLAERTIYMIGGNYHALAVYAEAARFYELYAANFPQQREAKSALANAATFRASLGQHDQAIANFETYLTRYPEDEKRSADLELVVAELLEKKGDEDAAIDRYTVIAEKYKGPRTTEQRLVALKELGRLLLQRGGSDDGRRGEEQLQLVVRRWQSLSTAAREDSRAGARAASEAHLLLAERLLAEMLAIETSGLSKKGWEKKLEAAALVSASLEAIVDIDWPEWVVAAYVTRGALYEHLASVVTDGSGVAALSKRASRDLDRLLREVDANTPAAAAVASYERAVELARREGVGGEHVRRAMRRLTALAPGKHTPMSELLPPPRAREGLSRAPMDLLR